MLNVFRNTYILSINEIMVLNRMDKNGGQREDEKEEVNLSHSLCALIVRHMDDEDQVVFVCIEWLRENLKKIWTGDVREIREYWELEEIRRMKGYFSFIGIENDYFDRIWLIKDVRYFKIPRYWTSAKYRLTYR